MAGLVLTFVACWLIIATAPTTPIGRQLRALLIDRPVDRLARISRGDVAVGIVLTVAWVMIAFVGEGDGVRMAMMAVPDAAVWLTTFEISAYLDVMIAIAAAASNMRMRGFGARLLAMTTRRPCVGGKPRSVRMRKAKALVANNDDEHPHVVASAA